MSNEPRTISAHDAEMLAFTSPQMSSGPWTYVAEQDSGSSRWASHHRLVVRHDDGSFWGLSYSLGLTEMQDHTLPWEDAEDDEQLRLTQVFPHTKTIVEYRTTAATA